MANRRPEFNLDNLGYHLDGWAEIVDGMGDKVDNIHEPA